MQSYLRLIHRHGCDHLRRRYVSSAIVSHQYNKNGTILYSQGTIEQQQHRHEQQQQQQQQSPPPSIISMAGRRVRFFSTNEDGDASSSSPSSSSPSSFYVVDHSEAYEAAMQGPHGRQLALARLEGEGMDDQPFDPFLDEDMMTEMQDSDEVEGEDEDYGDDVVEAEYSESTNSDDNNDEDAETEEPDGGEPDDDDDDDDDEYVDASSDDTLVPMYNNDGTVKMKKSTMATLRAGFPSGGKFAVIELGGTQHKVTTDDLIVANKLKPVDKYKIGSVHTLTDVMLVGSTHMTLVGVPFVTGAEVDVMVEEITRDEKVIVFKKRRRKHSQRKNGFRRDITLLRVLDVRMPPEYDQHNHVGRDIISELENSIATVESHDATTMSTAPTSIEASPAASDITETSSANMDVEEEMQSNTDDYTETQGQKVNNKI